MSTIRDNIKDEWAAFYERHHRDRAVIHIGDVVYRVIHIKSSMKLYADTSLCSARDRAEEAVAGIEASKQCYIVDVRVEVELALRFLYVNSDYTAYYRA